MTGRRAYAPVPLAFEEATLRISVRDILPLREISATIRKSVKYGQIASSIEEVGIIEPPVVVRDRNDRGRYHLLDGHLRLDILRERGDEEVIEPGGALLRPCVLGGQESIVRAVPPRW